MTNKIFGGKGIGPIEGVQRTRKVESKKAESSNSPKDRVDFSSVLQEVNKARETSAPAATERAQKVAALKAQIDSGNYRPDLEKVAESLLKFIVEDK